MESVIARVKMIVIVN